MNINVMVILLNVSSCSISKKFFFSLLNNRHELYGETHKKTLTTYVIFHDFSHEFRSDVLTK